MRSRSAAIVPVHVAVIMDGNGRWARSRGLPRALGHRAGVKALRRAVEACPDLGIRYLTAYTFSTENWQRPRSEVERLMVLFGRSIDEHRRDLMANNVRVRVIGRLQALPARVRLKFEELATATAINTGVTMTLAISYGGRAEIVDACRRAVAAGRPPGTDADFAAMLYAPDLPDPDLLIRTGGDQRISNYLLWQLAYTELYFTDTLWPDFGAKDLADAVADFARRRRRYGRVDG
ncbi:di-trans,poly-cis-decaprenylcistransferase [candidate division WOR-3 bacterium]|nr:di-trans,poly-cis-decaprenylcistransferase [candidate division WOR-3 bacterium]